LHRARLAPPADPAADGAEGQRLQLGPEAGRHRAQRQVRRGGGERALAQLGPGAQRAAALAQLDAPFGLQVEVLAQPRQIDVRQVGKGLAVPFAPVTGVAREHRLAEAPDQGEAFAPALGRRGVQPDLVAPAPVAQHQLHRIQRHRRRGAALVDPAHAATAHQQLGQ
jgi:hypothetical protein